MASIKKQRATAKRPTGRRVVSEQVRRQHQVRTTAPQSAAFGPIVQQPLTTWTQSTDALEATAVEMDVHAQAMKKLRSTLHLAQAAFHADEARYIAAVDLVSDGDAATVRSLGYDAKVAQKGAARPVEPPATVVAKPGTDPGFIHLRWTAVARARAYAVQISVDPPTEASWTALDGETGLRRKVGGLRSGQRYWFRVATVGRAGQSRYGEPVVATAR